MQASEEELMPLRKAYWDRVREGGEIEVAGKVFVDKHPLNTLKLPLIARLFPNAKILFACRDPRDVVLSVLPAPLQDEPGDVRAADRARCRCFVRWRDESGQKCCGQHSALIGGWCVTNAWWPISPRSCAASAIFWDWTGSRGMDDFAVRARERERSTPSTAQLARGLDRSLKVHWKNYAAALEPILPTLQNWVERFEYPPAR